MKHELAAFCIDRLRQRGFAGRTGTVRMVGPDLQWVARVERVAHVDQVNVELGIVFSPSPPAGRDQCRVLWSLADLVGVRSAEVSRALVPVGDQSLAERKEVVGEALDTASELVLAHLTRERVAVAYRAGRLERAFMFAEARALLDAC